MDGETAEQGATAATETATAAAGTSQAPATTAQGGDATGDGPTTIFHEDEEEEQEEKSVDITETHFKYTKLRSAFGKQTQFLEDRPRIHCGLRANTARYHPLFQQQSFVNKSEDTLEALRDLTTNTSRAEFRTFSVLHTEGGWPKEINLREHDMVEKTRRKLQREESFLDAVPNLAKEAEYLVKHNNTLGLCEPLNKRPYVPKRDTKPYASVIAVYKCPTPHAKRPVSRITFAPGNQGRMAVAYCPYEFDPTFREHSCEAFFWEVNNATRPEGMVRAAAQIVDLQYHPSDVHSVCGALFTGQVCTWDNRVGPNPQSISSFGTSHEDVCTNAKWTNAEGGTHEFFSAGLDGGIIWWDERNLSERLDAVYADIEIGRNDPKQAVPITTLEYDCTLPKKFIVGTQFGQVIPFAREEKMVKKSKSKVDTREPSRKPSLLASEEDEDEDEEENEDEEEEEEEEGDEEEQEDKEEEEEAEEQKKAEEEAEEKDEEEEEGEEEDDEEEDGEEEEGDEEMNIEDLVDMSQVRTPPPEEDEEELVIGPFQVVSVYEAHRGPVTAIQRNPAFPGNFMSCGGYHLRIYSEDVLESGIMWTSPGDSLYSYCQWLRGRPCCLVASRIDGCLEFWDLLVQGSTSILTTKICEEALSTVCPSDSGQHIAAGTINGDIRMVQVCPFMASFDDNDRDALGQLFYREARREQHLAERMREKKKKMVSAAQSKQGSKGASKAASAAASAASKQAASAKASGAASKAAPKKPDPYKNPEILTDKKFFDMLAEEKKRQGVNAFPDKKEASKAYSKMLIEGRMEEKRDAVSKSKKQSDSELGTQQLMDVNDAALRKADALLDEEDEDEEEEGEDDDEVPQLQEAEDEDLEVEQGEEAGDETEEPAEEEGEPEQQEE